MTETEFMKKFGENLKNVLEDSLMSPAELAKDANISRSTISYYINGERMPTVKNLINIVYATGCNFEDLFDYDVKII